MRSPRRAVAEVVLEDTLETDIELDEEPAAAENEPASEADAAADAGPELVRGGRAGARRLSPSLNRIPSPLLPQAEASTPRP